VPIPRDPGVRRAFLTDPDGHIIELMETGVPVTGDEAPQRHRQPDRPTA